MGRTNLNIDITQVNEDLKKKKRLNIETILKATGLKDPASKKAVIRSYSTIVALVLVEVVQHHYRFFA